MKIIYNRIYNRIFHNYLQNMNSVGHWQTMQIQEAVVISLSSIKEGFQPLYKNDFLMLSLLETIKYSFSSNILSSWIKYGFQPLYKMIFLNQISLKQSNMVLVLIFSLPQTNMVFNHSLKIIFLHYISLKQLIMALNHSKNYFLKLRLFETINYGIEPPYKMIFSNYLSMTQ